MTPIKIQTRATLCRNFELNDKAEEELKGKNVIKFGLEESTNGHAGRKHKNDGGVIILEGNTAVTEQDEKVRNIDFF